MNTLETIFAAKLLDVKAIKLQPDAPFTWASGWKSPFYCDNRKTLSYPELRSFVKLETARIVMERFPEVEAVAGVATGAIPQGALVADVLGHADVNTTRRHYAAMSDLNKRKASRMVPLPSTDTDDQD